MSEEADVYWQAASKVRQVLYELGAAEAQLAAANQRADAYLAAGNEAQNKIARTEAQLAVATRECDDQRSEVAKLRDALEVSVKELDWLVRRHYSLTGEMFVRGKFGPLDAQAGEGLTAAPGILRRKS